MTLRSRVEAGRTGLLHRLGLPYTVRVGPHRFALHGRIKPWVAWKVKMGRYESCERDAGYRCFDFTRPLVELGGGIGSTTVQWHAVLRPGVLHRVVECNPASARLVERQRVLNGGSWEVCLGAVAYRGDHVSVLDTGWIRTNWGVEDQAGGVRVEARTVGGWLAPGWCNLAVDVEGMEYEILRHDLGVLRERVLGLVVDWTPQEGRPAAIRDGIRAVEAAGFQWEVQDGNVSGFKNPGYWEAI